MRYFKPHTRFETRKVRDSKTQKMVYKVYDHGWAVFYRELGRELSYAQFSTANLKTRALNKHSFWNMDERRPSYKTPRKPRVKATVVTEAPADAPAIS